MPVANQLSHRNIQELNLPYKSFVSPTLTEPFFASGSTDLLTSSKGYCERRPGFSSALESGGATAFTSLQKIYMWSRWDGTFVYMANDISGGNSVVYKLVIGTDTTFQSLFTDSGNTGVFDFVVSNNTCYFANGHVSKKYDPTNGLSTWGITAPSVTPTLGSNAGTTFSLQVGWKYVYCYYNSATGHLSSPSTVSASTGTETVASVTVAVTASGDSQVDKIKVFRTTDGGGGNYFEISNSPFANSTATITDTTTDAALNVNSLAPVAGFNDPPPAWNHLTYWNGRIWGKVNNKLWFTGFEEIRNGVQEECVPSGSAGNFWAFDQLVTGPAPTQVALIVFCPSRIYAITGDTLDTFRRTLFTDKRGSREWTCIATLGGMVAWRDTSGQIWGSDGSTVNELGMDIRPDLASVGTTNTAMTFHVAGNFHWLVFSSNAKVFVYDLDTGQWMPPWTITSAILYSGESASGTYTLVASLSNKALKLSNSNAFNDNSSTYSWTAVTNLFNLVPDFGRRFSYIAQGIYDEPSRLGKPWYLGIERSTFPIKTVSMVVDDDSGNSTTSWTDITQQQKSPEIALNRTQGQNLIQDVFPMIKTAGRRIAFKLTGATADQQDKLYSMFIAYQAMR